MRMYPSPVIASELARTILVKNYFYRVRIEAARALAMVCPVLELHTPITKNLANSITILNAITLATSSS